ncbi:ABC transporter substrate-binding protein [Dactylosporangium matsuzakiense]|uniref:Thiamine pyrimidine synthase n=1 Tax=Dactylosporangium matsuzakiense TaxID=53360 RepID=A0A9W6KF70_9ACTN|nr:ABC transporter substrate-binding protein [Dactylosporangium matsuzakiense]GLK99180.1 ABC transporter substrate-binding protein [Dactylosporangium matsuzakiense]
MPTRRSLLRALPLAGAAALAGCSSPPHDTGSGRFGPVRYRLSWVKNVQFAGAYIADANGHYRAAGLDSVELVAGGPAAAPVDADVMTGKAHIGVSAPDITAAAIRGGATLVIIGAEFQKCPFAITSPADKPITTPEQLYGKRIGVQVANETTWAAFLKVAGLDAARITKVPVQFDPLPLTQGVVDGWFSFITDEPNQLRVKGFEVSTMLLADHGYPLAAQTYCVRRDTVSRDRELLKAFLRAQVQGWRQNLADPGLGARLAVQNYGKDLGLDLAEQQLSSVSENALLATPDTNRRGLLTMTPELVERNIALLGATGSSVTAAQLFDLSLIDEVFQADPGLLAGVPSPG